MHTTSKPHRAHHSTNGLALSRIFFGALLLLPVYFGQISVAQTDVKNNVLPEGASDAPLPPTITSNPGPRKADILGDELSKEKKNNPRLKINNDVPAGFESIGGATSNIVDLIYNGKNLGTVDITGNDETISFDDPTIVAYLLPEIKNADSLVELLSQEFDSNVDKICFAKQDPVGCGTLDAAPVALIYNSGLLSVDLFIAAELQSVARLDLTRYLARPGEKQSTILSVNTVASDFQGQEPSLDAATYGLIGYGNGYIQSGVDFSSNRNQFRLRDLSLNHYYRDHEVQLGAFSHTGGSGLLDIRLLGATFSSSLKTRLDLDYAFSTQLIVYLVRRSVVQIAVDDRVLTGDTYDAGNQTLDTRALPDGRYEVEIRIVDPVSGLRKETRIFTKNEQLPPLNESLYSFTAGVPLNHADQHVFPKMDDRRVLSVTWAKRVKEYSAIELGLHQVDDQVILNSKITLMDDHVTTQMGVSIAEHGTRIFSFRSGYLNRDFSAELSMEHATTGDDVEDSLLHEMIPNDYSQIGLSLNRSFGNTAVGVSSRYSRKLPESELNEDTKLDSAQYALYLRRSILTKSDLRGSIDGRLQKDEIGTRASIRFNVFLGKPNWTTNIAYIAAQAENDEQSNQLTLESSWQHTTAKSSRWAVSAYANQLDENNSLGAQVKLEHPRFQAGWSSQWTNASAFGNTLNSVASLSMHLGVDELGGAFSGTDYAESGVIVDVQGQPVGAPYDIIVNGLKLSAGRVGSAQMVGLQPFEHYSIKLVPRGLLSNGIGESIYEFSLFPGNVERITVVAKNLVLLVTELVRENGDSVGNAVVEIDGNPLLIDSGIFQGELPQGDIITIRPEAGPPCRFEVPLSPGEDVFVTETALVCTTTQ